ncbi:hypothetical protein GE09DRAFT_446959 [Coniochaeta sp. 2T2.1]|nr:hypothetical protein GE09DRAFT_446959 [Coniochaeta sp. 2T2.1]
MRRLVENRCVGGQVVDIDGVGVREVAERGFILREPVAGSVPGESLLDGIHDGIRSIAAATTAAAVTRTPSIGIHGPGDLVAAPLAVSTTDMGHELVARFEQGITPMADGATAAIPVNVPHKTAVGSEDRATAVAIKGLLNAWISLGTLRDILLVGMLRDRLPVRMLRCSLLLRPVFADSAHLGDGSSYPKNWASGDDAGRFTGQCSTDTPKGFQVEAVAGVAGDHEILDEKISWFGKARHLPQSTAFRPQVKGWKLRIKEKGSRSFQAWKLTNSTSTPVSREV